MAPNLVAKTHRWITQAWSDSFDNIARVNTYVIFLAFMGTSISSVSEQSLSNNDACDAPLEMSRNVITLGAISFGLFIISHVLAVPIAKDFLKGGRGSRYPPKEKMIGIKVHFLVSVITSMIGLIFISLSVVDFLQIRLGLRSCGAKETILATWMVFTATGIVLIRWLFHLFFVLRK